MFEPVHRVVFNFQGNIFSEMSEYFQNALEIKEVESFSSLQTIVRSALSAQVIGLAQQKGLYSIRFLNPNTNLVVGTVQQFLDQLLKKASASSLDYVHGDEVLKDLCMKPNNMGFLLPAMQKNDFFRTVILDGSLPRKTFSMGDAREKRFYLECRKIQ